MATIAVGNDVGCDAPPSAVNDWVKGIVNLPCGDCGAVGSIVRSGRCVTCLECGWSPCLRR